MIPLATFHTPPGPCSYLPDRRSRMRYDVMAAVSPAEYMTRLDDGWRRFGFALFRPECPSCSACQSLRVDVRSFRPSQSQKRARKANADVVLEVGEPSVTDEKLALYDRFHAHQIEHVGWTDHGSESADNYANSFVDNPFPTEEWRYTLAGKLVGVGYVDALPGGLSAIYFFHDPDHRDRSLGTLNVLRVIDATVERGLPYAYLGYVVEGCRSLEYKGRFRPNEVRTSDGEWVPFREAP